MSTQWKFGSHHGHDEVARAPRTGQKRSIIILPTEPNSFAEKLFEGWGAKESSQVLDVLPRFLTNAGKTDRRLPIEHEPPLFQTNASSQR